MKGRDLEVDLRLGRLENVVGLVVETIAIAASEKTGKELLDHWKGMANDIKAAFPGSTVDS